MHNKLLLATNNLGKLKEYRSLLSGLSLQLISPREIGVTTKINEIGRSFEENAKLKAVTLSVQSNLLTLADDSGLEVDALGGEPGIYSARYAGEGASDKDRNDLILAKLRHIPWEKRTAKFRCVVAIAKSASNVDLFSGVCNGLITYEPKGNYGFGYDPIFYIPELGKTMAELQLNEKNKVSHRGKAVKLAYKSLCQQPCTNRES